MTPPTQAINLPIELKELLANCSNLPSLPATALKVIDASKDPDIGLSDVSEIISKDPAISAKLLKIANSPLYSLRRTIHNLREALTLLGLNASLTIALSFSLINSLRNNQPDSMNNDHYWKRSLLAATIARHMGFRLGLSNLEDLFLTALLQDIGILALECANPNFYSPQNINISHTSKMLFERDTFETDHAQIGAWLLQSWNLPKRIYQVTANSHNEINNENTSSDETLFQHCVNLSGNIADIWMDDNQTEILQNSITDIKEVLKINNEEYNEFIVDINEMLPEISTLFEVSITDNDTRNRVLDQAKELLVDRNLQIIKQSENDRHQLEAMEEKAKGLEDETHHDTLTGIHNRKYFEHILEEEFENANINSWPLSLAFIDIDYFKDINDQLGHLIGDLVLKDVAAFINTHIRQTDVLARYGGDEFVILLPGATNTVAKNMLMRVLKTMRSDDFSTANGLRTKPTISIGLASHLDKHDFTNARELLSAADKALYKVKKSGRDNIDIF